MKSRNPEKKGRVRGKGTKGPVRKEGETVKLGRAKVGIFERLKRDNGKA